MNIHIIKKNNYTNISIKLIKTNENIFNNTIENIILYNIILIINNILLYSENIIQNNKEVKNEQSIIDIIKYILLLLIDFVIINNKISPIKYILI